jgi:hypothetical protein
VRAVYAIALTLGTVGVMAWVVAAAVGGTVEGRSGADPEHRFGGLGRAVVAGSFGFGMAGLSASYAGWPWPLALAAAVAAAAGLVYVSGRLVAAGRGA